MFRFYTRNEEQIFDNKDQAIDFYNQASFETCGAESDRYADYAYELLVSPNQNEVEYLFSGEVRLVLRYDPQENCLREV